MSIRKDLASELRELAREKYDVSKTGYLREKDPKKRLAIIDENNRHMMASSEYRAAEFLDSEQDAIDRFFQAEHTHSVSME